MRFKYYLRGAGLGIIIATIILTISFHLHGTTMSDEEVITRAESLGMVMPEDSESTELLEDNKN